MTEHKHSPFTPLINHNNVSHSYTEEGQDCKIFDSDEFGKLQEVMPRLPMLLSLWMANFLASMDRTIIANIMNSVTEEFKESHRIQWVATSFLLTSTVFQPIYGKLSDVTGRRFVLVLAYSLFLLGCLVTAYARNIWEFAFGRAICGIGAGGIPTMCVITMGDMFSVKEQSIYQSYAHIIYTIGEVLGAPIGGIALETVGWRAIFLAQVPVLTICIYLTLCDDDLAQQHIPPHGERLTWKNISRMDLSGSILLIISLCGVILLSSATIIEYWMWLLVIASAGLFIINELYWVSECIIPFRKLKGAIGLTSLLLLVSSFIEYSELYRTPLFLQLVQNMSTSTTGVVLLFSSAASAVATLLSGWVLRTTRTNLGEASFNHMFGSMTLQVAGLTTILVLIHFLNPDQSSIQVTSEHRLAPFMMNSDSAVWKIIYVAALSTVSSGHAGLLVSTLTSIFVHTETPDRAMFTGAFYLFRYIGSVLGASTALSVYESVLSKRLWNYLDLNNMKDSYDGLMHDSSYLRQNFTGSRISDLLDIYKSSFQTSYVPNIKLGEFSIALLVWYLMKQ
ncbi:Vba1p Ecym_7399 [Eremothecium cymbalariae DBVPG|uniref:Major facilitator superfamily (MFS) profile domain-containing protein n=1 Tax=Eremothecium cymbalariae (strain CBS 270.75 / DBVPG 7215 / KCTC 17166 / NRRL Y-17582) TaxID=931890 RepID=G8JWL0_ERECY|nr:hypothetical protein Ecym_7399 [Eremothecium cymbalariae DBVPG\